MYSVLYSGEDLRLETVVVSESFHLMDIEVIYFIDLEAEHLFFSPRFNP